MSAHTLTGSRALAAVVTLFAYNGLVIGVYTASLPSIRDRLGMSETHLMGVFIVTGVAAVTSMQLSGRLADKFGARRVCLAMILPLIVASAGYGFAPTYPLLLVTAVFLGTGNGGIDVAMNALGVQVEAKRLETGRSPIMSFFHGTWAIGTFLGSISVSLAGTALGLDSTTTVRVCAGGVSIIGVAVCVLSWVITPETEPVSHVDTSGEKAKIPRSMYLMGLMAIAFGLGEGTASDWSGTHVEAVAHVDPRIAAWAVTAMNAFMVVIRLTGDRLVKVFGRLLLVALGGACASAGYLIAAFASDFPILLVGWALVGLGIGVIAPQVYASAGHSGGGRGLAVVVTFGYATFLIGPALIGGLINLMGIQRAFIVPGTLLLGLIPLAYVTMGPGSAKDHQTPPSEQELR